ncbi:MAG: hypothetical protein B7Z37_27545, partial [Verrucomicrobia bacterium 12-59-8]
ARAALPMPLGAGETKPVANKYPVSIRPMTEEVSISLVWTLLLHMLWLGLFSAPFLLQFKPDVLNVGMVLHGPDGLNEAGYHKAFVAVVEDRRNLVIYFVSLYFASFLLGRGALWTVRHFRLDHDWMVVRLEDQWFYFLRGEIFRFREFKNFLGENVPLLSGTYISLVVSQGGADFLYKGFLWDFHLDREGKLDRLVLHHAIRSEFAPKEKPAALADAENGSHSEVALPVQAAEEDKKLSISDASWKFQRVSSQLFTVRYADCKTLACTYFYVRRPEAQFVPAGAVP